MNIRFVKTYLKKCNNQLHIAHSQDNVSMLWLWCDSVWSLLRYGCTVTEYVQCGFYKMRSFERKRIVTFPKFRKLVKLNDPKYIPILRDKDKFNSFFAPFVHRDWLASSKMTFDEFTSFCQKHSQIVLKPLDGTEGHGVSIITPPPVTTMINCKRCSINFATKTFLLKREYSNIQEWFSVTAPSIPFA